VAARVEFLLNLYRYKVFPFAAELEELERANQGFSKVRFLP
jgi:hypothetical protein